MLDIGTLRLYSLAKLSVFHTSKNVLLVMSHYRRAKFCKLYRCMKMCHSCNSEFLKQ